MKANVFPVLVALLILPNLIHSEAPLRELRKSAHPASRDRRVSPTGTIVPQPSSPEVFSDEPTPVTLRIVNRKTQTIYLQGMRDNEKRIQFYFYHRDKKTGWKPFFESLPCDLPTCRNIHAPRNNCSKPIPFIVPLGPSGTPDSVKEIKWGGLLYERSEATQEDRKRRYCYKGWIPKAGRMRVELEFSETVQEEKGKRGMIGARDHSVVEFDLPPSQEIYEIAIGS